MRTAPGRTMWGVMVMSSSSEALFDVLVGALEAGQLAEAGKAFDGLGFVRVDEAGEQRGLARGDGDGGGHGAAVEDGDAVDGAAGEGLDLQVQEELDVAAVQDLRGELEGDAEVLILESAGWWSGCCRGTARAAS